MRGDALDNKIFTRYFTTLSTQYELDNIKAKKMVANKTYESKLHDLSAPNEKGSQHSRKLFQYLGLGFKIF